MEHYILIFDHLYLKTKVVKNLIKKVIPILHAIKTSPSMLLELSSTPAHIARQNKDWETLTQRFPGFDSYFSQKEDILKIFRTPHLDYIQHYSAPLISLSLERAAFFYFFCQLTRPENILDLGSGFSTYVFKCYLKNAKIGQIVSVDDSPFWLQETERFLKSHALDGKGLTTWEQFEAAPTQSFDLIFLDISDFEFRLHILPALLQQVAKGALLLIDDFHVPAYRKAILEACQAQQLLCFSLRKVTRTRLSHNALIIA